LEAGVHTKHMKHTLAPLLLVVSHLLVSNALNVTTVAKIVNDIALLVCATHAPL
jgi:hypothetical protein